MKKCKAFRARKCRLIPFECGWSVPLLFQHVPYSIVTEPDLALQRGVVRVSSREAFTNREAGLMRGQRPFQVALHLAHVAELLVTDRQCALPRDTVRIGRGKARIDRVTLLQRGECARQVALCGQTRKSLLQLMERARCRTSIRCVDRAEAL